MAIPVPNLGVYLYRYKWSDAPFLGLMADEVAKAHPEAVSVGAGGYKAVNYGYVPPGHYLALAQSVMLGADDLIAKAEAVGDQARSEILKTAKSNFWRAATGNAPEFMAQATEWIANNPS